MANLRNSEAIAKREATLREKRLAQRLAEKMATKAKTLADKKDPAKPEPEVPQRMQVQARGGRKKNPHVSILFYLHTAETPGYAMVYHRITYQGIRAELNSTGIRVRMGDWDKPTKCVLHSDPDAVHKNTLLTDIKHRLQVIDNSFRFKRMPYTAQQIKAVYEGADMYFGVVPVFDEYLKDRKKLVDLQLKCGASKKGKKKGLSPETYRNYQQVRDQLLAFLIAKRQTALPFDSFDSVWLDKYEQHLVHVCDFEESTIYKHLKTIKQVTKWAKKTGLASVNPLDSVSLDRPEPGVPVFLTTTQVANLRDVPFKNAAMQRAAHVLVVYCRTGFHYSDLRQMAKNAETEVVKGLDGGDWIHHNRLKTDVTAKVPIFQEVQAIIDIYGGWEKLPIVSDQILNKWLKLIAAERRLPDNLSVKMGRNTMADWLLNERCWSEEAVKVVLGLKSTASLKPYVRADERRVIGEILREKQNKAA